MTDCTSIKKPVRVAGMALIKLRLLPKVVILRMDGGICSQMHFYLVGRTLEKKGNRVLYDLDWFRKCGKDTEGRFVRNFDLLKLFPDLRLESHIPSFVRRIYVSLFYCWNNYFNKESDPAAWTEFKSPLYLAGYFRDQDQMFGEFFDSCFQLDLSIPDQANRNIIEEIDSAGSSTCAIHVRRGDLSGYNEAYGEPADDSFFKRAISAVTENNKIIVKFYIFSDEPEWCERHIIPLLEGREYKLIDHNGSDKGYMDLLLMSRCHHIITSQGSMGKYAALLREPAKRDGKVVLLKGQGREWRRRFRNALEC